MLPFFRPQDIADILIMSFLVYQLYSWFKNTRALQVVIGLGFLVLLYVATKNLGLFMTSWVLQELGTVLFVLLIVIFQSEIRQALYRFSLLRNMFGRQGSAMQLDLMDLSRTIFDLARERTGAIIVFQRRELLDEYLLHGIPLDSLVSSQLVGTLFREGTPLHDGAVVIRDNRVTQASCHLPLSNDGDLPSYYGTRHRAALGLSERSDAAVVVVSEERGEVSLALAGKLTRIDTPEHLSGSLHSLLVHPAPEVSRISLRRILFSDIWPKLTILLLVCICWLIITAKQGGIVTVTAPLKFHNLPEGLALVKSSPEEVEVQLKAFSSLTPSPKQIDIAADMNLARTREGVNSLSVKSSDFQLPLGVIITGINPSVIRVTMEKKVRKTLWIKAKTVGRNSRRKLIVDPPTVEAEGPEHILEQLESVETEDISVSALGSGEAVEKRLLSPAPQVKLLREEPVRISLGRK
ncbi:MAG TPA: diadenylate cyclase CdaA [Geobacteraceae bacterium]|nr:diadenylate cyclase CdaA [Geobacteraceae bacterium]